MHEKSMAAMMKTMSLDKAKSILKKANKTLPSLLQTNNAVLRGNRGVDPYAELDSAKQLLNDMIYEAAEKYDEEIQCCTDFYSVQCAALEKGQSDLLAGNYIAASSRTLMAAASATIERCRNENQETQEVLRGHKADCKKQIGEINNRLKIVLGDIEVLTRILQMTDCKQNTQGTNLFQLKHCRDECSRSVVQFGHDAIQEKVSAIQSEFAQGLLHDTMADLVNGIEGLESVSLLQTSQTPEGGVNATPIYKPPTPKTQKLGACSDPYKGGPPPPGSKLVGCKLTNSSCEILQGRFLRIQAGVIDEKESLMVRRSKKEKACKQTTETLLSKIRDCQSTILAAQTDLADATGKEADATKYCGSVTTYNEQLNNEVKAKMKSCRANYAKYEGEMCALKKIRGELYKMKGSKPGATKHKSNGFFTDCSMGEWTAEQCTKECGGGEQHFTREIVAVQNGGAKCLPQRQLKSCNNQECLVDCVQEPWSGWSECTAECGGGVKQRLRRTETPMRYGGTPCGDTKQETECNSQACDQDCQLSEWTKWGACSKDCGGGTSKRYRYVKTAATGSGKCPGRWAPERLEYKFCGEIMCENSPKHETLACIDNKADIILLLDGSTSMTQKGWDAEIKLSKKFVSAFTEDGATVNAQVSVILYSGPKFWSEWVKCFTKKKMDFDLRMRACGVKTVTDLTSDLADVQTKLDGLSWPKGGTLTSRALKAAEDQLQNGRVNTRTNVIVLTDGKPMSTRWTREASEKLRKKARLLWVPITRNAPLYNIKKWATRRWQENVFEVKTFTDLDKKQDEIVTHIVSSICPHDFAVGMFD